jgi:hypothetical protein
MRGGETGRAALRVALDDEAPEVRRQAASTFAMGGRRDDLEELARRLETESDPSVRQAIAWALRSAGGPVADRNAAAIDEVIDLRGLETARAIDFDFEALGHLGPYLEGRAGDLGAGAIGRVEGVDSIDFAPEEVSFGGGGAHDAWVDEGAGAGGEVDALDEGDEVDEVDGGVDWEDDEEDDEEDVIPAGECSGE